MFCWCFFSCCYYILCTLETNKTWQWTYRGRLGGHQLRGISLVSRGLLFFCFRYLLWLLKTIIKKKQTNTQAHKRKRELRLFYCYDFVFVIFLFNLLLFFAIPVLYTSRYLLLLFFILIMHCVYYTYVCMLDFSINLN